MARIFAKKPFPILHLNQLYSNLAVLPNLASQAYESPGFRRVTAIRPIYLQYLLLRGVNALWQVHLRKSRESKILVWRPGMQYMQNKTLTFLQCHHHCHGNRSSRSGAVASRAHWRGVQNSVHKKNAYPTKSRSLLLRILYSILLLMLARTIPIVSFPSTDRTLIVSPSGGHSSTWCRLGPT